MEYISTKHNTTPVDTAYLLLSMASKFSYRG